MVRGIILKLASTADAQPIAHMSRDLIETGLGWSWAPTRVHASIRCPDTAVLTASGKSGLVGFAIMSFAEEDAFLDLLGVRPDYQRRGLGRQLVRWLEKSAVVAGISTIYLEVRIKNRAARAFYQSLGYRDAVLIPRYYGGQEAALRMARQLGACG